VWNLLLVAAFVVYLLFLQYLGDECRSLNDHVPSPTKENLDCSMFIQRTSDILFEYLLLINLKKDGQQRNPKWGRGNLARVPWWRENKHKRYNQCDNHQHNQSAHHGHLVGGLFFRGRIIQVTQRWLETVRNIRYERTPDSVCSVNWLYLYR